MKLLPRYLRGKSYRANRRGGLSLIELVVSTSTASILVIGLTSTMFVALGALPTTATGPQTTLQAGKIADQIVAELETALYITNLSATSVGFTVPDRNGDGLAESICYDWSGTAGTPPVGIERIACRPARGAPFTHCNP